MVDKGYKAIVKLLFKIGKADVNIKDKNGQTPLYRAIRNGNGNKAVVKCKVRI